MFCYISLSVQQKRTHSTVWGATFRFTFMQWIWNKLQGLSLLVLTCYCFITLLTQKLIKTNKNKRGSLAHQTSAGSLIQGSAFLSIALERTFFTTLVTWWKGHEWPLVRWSITITITNDRVIFILSSVVNYPSWNKH